MYRPNHELTMKNVVALNEQLSRAYLFLIIYSQYGANGNVPGRELIDNTVALLDELGASEDEV